MKEALTTTQWIGISLILYSFVMNDEKDKKRLRKSGIIALIGASVVKWGINITDITKESAAKIAASK